jgi:hypothetical protein
MLVYTDGRLDMNRLATMFLILSAVASSTTASATKKLPFIEDDYVRARAEAKKRDVPLFVEVWAPW